MDKFVTKYYLNNVEVASIDLEHIPISEELQYIYITRRRSKLTWAYWKDAIKSFRPNYVLYTCMAVVALLTLLLGFVL